MGAPLYFLILCASSTNALPCAANELRREVYALTRQQCLVEMHRSLAKLEFKGYKGYCVQWGGKGAIDDEWNLIGPGVHAGIYLSSPADYRRAESAGASSKPRAAP